MSFTLSSGIIVRGINEVATRFQKRVKQLSTDCLICYAVTILVAKCHRPKSEFAYSKPTIPQQFITHKCSRYSPYVWPFFTPFRNPVPPFQLGTPPSFLLPHSATRLPLSFTFNTP